MRLYPTRAAVDVALAGMAVSATGVLFRQPAVLAWGAALLVGLAIARAVTLLSVTQIRASGFECCSSSSAGSAIPKGKSRS